MMTKKKDKFLKIDERDAKVTENSFTQAVKKAGLGSSDNADSIKRDAETQENGEISLKAYNDLMRASEAKNDSSIEGEKFRRDE
jgi:hypothetical protein